MTRDSESLNHLNAIRNAFEKGNVAVMVGAGFSCNAQGGEQLKMWPALAEVLWRELNPTGSATGFSSALVTQLGEQYARVFSPPALESLLKRLIPDEKVSPGPLHEQFVQLPWTEIFTTNYDTLIERAAEGIVERAHYTVTCREDIPQSKILGRRRIVKLHGSFPSQRPFIFTEEDYRQYPEKFAPFVNLVRQSLLENVFCLIGFSGDDPNFLHWIGWVRDMLDKHALPIYMFVGQDPSIGQRKLLEARKVTPVVLPLPDGCDPADYAARYAALFTLLSTPLKSPDMDWGDGLHELSALSGYTADFTERYERILKAFPKLLELRNTYPGWLVAPASVRARFAQSLRWLPTPLDAPDIYERLEGESPRVGVVLLAQYCWQQNVLLQCFDDRLAAIGMRLLGSTKDVLKTELLDSELEILSRLNVKTPGQFKVQWRELLLGLLRWTREELRSDQFRELKALTEGELFGDRILGDVVRHESILLALYEGQRDLARELLLGWDLRSSDEFMYVRKGALLAEVGAVEPGLKTCLEGLLRLRSNQRPHSENARYLSEEAWACLAIRNIQRSIHPFRFTNGGTDAEEVKLSEKIGRRLADLGAKGFDVRRERDKIASSLDAEAQPPSNNRVSVSEFELARYTSSVKLGVNSELQSKVEAAFSWLTLVDRVALVPRAGMVTFDLTSYLQAGWWAQYWDSSQRVLSVAIRTMSTDVLKPKDLSQPAHKTGWLSRFQVAKLDPALALQVCVRSLDLVERTMTSHVAIDEVTRIVGFHLEVFSRLVVRIRASDTASSFAGRVIALFHTPRISELAELWCTFSTALARCFEALPRIEQRALVPSIVGIPENPPGKAMPAHYAHNWLNYTELWGNVDAPPESLIDSAIAGELTRLIMTIKQAKQSKDPIRTDQCGRAWARLLWLNHLGFVSSEVGTAISAVLWQEADPWPLIPNHLATSSFVWPAPDGVDIDVVFRKWAARSPSG